VIDLLCASKMNEASEVMKLGELQFHSEIRFRAGVHLGDGIIMV
jgi:hypothetical protein